MKIDVNFEKYIPEYISPIGIVMLTKELTDIRMRILQNEYNRLEKRVKKYKRNTLPNNRLKMLGIPKRRKTKKRGF